MSCQTVDWVSRGVVVSSGSSPLIFLTVSGGSPLFCTARREVNDTPHTREGKGMMTWFTMSVI